MNGVTEPRTSWKQRAIWIGAFVALSALFAGLLVAGSGMWDWDTYQRVQFMPLYRDDMTADTHILYHHALRALMATGLSPSASIVLVTATSAAAFLLLVLRAAIAFGLSLRARILVVLAASLASPGLVALFLMREDNLPYIPLLFALYLMLYRDPADRSAATRSGIAGGILLAAGMMLNISLLVIPIALVVPCALWRWMPLRAHRAAVIIAVTFATYYLAHVTLFHGSRIALHEFLPQALALRDPTTHVPLVSLSRIEQYLGGLRAIALDPSVHMMQLPDALRTALVVVAPKILALLYAVLVVDTLRHDRRALWGSVRGRLDLAAVAGVALGFPYLYEPTLIERWDVMWAGLALVLVVRWARKPSRLARATIIAIVVVQSIGTAVTLAHHYDVAFTDPRIATLRDATDRIRAESRDPVIFPYDIDRLHLADIATRLHDTRLYLVHDAGETFVAYRVLFLQEHPVPFAEVRWALDHSHAPYLSPTVTPRMRAALGR
jgi:hypothetical protein